MLGEGDIFRTVLQPFVLYHFYDALYGSCFLFGGLVGFQSEDKAGFQAFALSRYCCRVGSCSPLSSCTAVHTLAVASCIVTPLKVAS